MSIVTPVSVVDPVTDIPTTQKYAVLQGGKEVTWNKVISTSRDFTNITFYAPPPNSGIIIDRHVLFSLPINVQGTATSGAPLVDFGFDYGNKMAPRAWPIHSNLNTISVSFNDTTVTINPREVIPYITRYYQGCKEFDDVISPTMPDYFADYGDQMGGAGMNSFRGYQNGGEIGLYTRSMFAPTAVVANQVINAGGAYNLTFEFVEPIMLSPFMYKLMRQPGFLGLLTWQFTFTFINGNPTRMFSWSTAGGYNPSGGAAMTLTIPDSPALHFRYITPRLTQVTSPVNVWPLSRITYWTTQANGGANVGAGAQVTGLSSQVAQLDEIPSSIFVVVRQDNNGLAGNHSDTFATLDSVTLNWKNKTGLFTSASRYQLFEMARKNGCNLNWPQFSGRAAADRAPLAGAWVNTVGSPLRIVPGEDFGLDEDEAPGVSGNFNLQVTVNCTNYGPARPLTLYLIIVCDGTITIGEGRANTNMGLLNRTIVLGSGALPKEPYVDLDNLIGGNLWGNFKNFVGRVASGVKKVLPYAKDAWNIGKQAVALGEKVAPVLAGLGLPEKQQSQEEDYDMTDGFVVDEDEEDLQNLRGGALQMREVEEKQPLASVRDLFVKKSNKKRKFNE